MLRRLSFSVVLLSSALLKHSADAGITFGFPICAFASLAIRLPYARPRLAIRDTLEIINLLEIQRLDLFPRSLAIDHQSFVLQSPILVTFNFRGW